METFIILGICGLVFGFIGMAIGDLGEKKNGPTGFMLGFLLGPIGCIIAAVIPSSKPAGVPAPQPADDHSRKIALLESQLAQLKATPKPSAKVYGIPDSNDGEIPTYKLD